VKASRKINNPTLNPLAGSLQIWDQPTQVLCKLLIVGAKAAIPYLTQEVAGLAQTGWILEGERVHPELVKSLHESGRARGFFIVETDAERLHTTLLTRLPGFGELLKSRQRAVAEVDRLYNLWLLTETARLGLPCVPSHPWGTLASRILELVGELAAKNRRTASARIERQ